MCMIFSFFKQTSSVVIVVFFLLLTTYQTTLALCDTTSGPFTVTRGDQAQISWSIVGASTCTGGFTEGLAYPSGAIDTVFSGWNNSTRAGVDTAGLGQIKAPQGTYTFTCQAPTLQKGCAVLQVNDCPNGTSWQC